MFPWMFCECSYWNIRAAPGQVLLSTRTRGSRGANASSSLDNVLFQVEFGLEAKVGEDTWLALGIPANQSKPEMRNSDAVIAGVMSPSMLLAAAPSPPAPSGSAARGSPAGFATNFFITAQQPCVEEAGGHIGVCPVRLKAMAGRKNPACSLHRKGVLVPSTAFHRRPILAFGTGANLTTMNLSYVYHCSRWGELWTNVTL